MARASRKQKSVVEFDRLERAQQVLALKRDFDLSYEQIGKQIDVAAGTAYNDLKWLIKRRRDEMSEEIEAQREVENERLGRLWQRWLPEALGNKEQGIEPDLRAAEFCLRLIGKRIELNGLAKPVKLALTDKDGNDLFTLEERSKRAAALFDKARVRRDRQLAGNGSVESESGPTNGGIPE